MEVRKAESATIAGFQRITTVAIIIGGSAQAAIEGITDADDENK